MAETCEHELYWYGAPANEQGWKCCSCDFKPGEPPGFSPHHDRELLSVKIDSILQDLFSASIVYVSNSCAGEALVEMAHSMCIVNDTYDSVSIARWLLELCGNDDHAAYWRKVSTGMLTGSDPRDRCRCGKLAQVFSVREGTSTSSCFEHAPGWNDHA